METERPSGSEGVVKSILSLTEEGLSDVVAQLLKNDSFVSAMQRAVTSSLAVKSTVDRSMLGVLSALHVPTLEDVEKVKERLAELEDALEEIEHRVGKLYDAAGGGASKAKRKRRRTE
jgi:predicted RecB family endonuclease